MALAAAAAVLAACGSSGSKAAVATTTSTPARGAARAAFNQCMAQHGVDLPPVAPGQNRQGDANQPGDGSAGAPGAAGTSDPSGTPRTPRTPRSLPPGVDQATFDQARQACQDKLPQQGPASAATLAAYAQCLQKNGYQAPDPAQGPATFFGGLNRNDPAFQAADAQCAQMLPNRQRNGTSATTTTTG